MAENEFTGLQLSAEEIRQFTGWPDAMIVDYMSLIERINDADEEDIDEALLELRELIQSHIDNTDNPHETSLVSLIDTLINLPNNGQILAFDGEKWVNQDIGNLIDSCCKDLVIIAEGNRDAIYSAKDQLDLGIIRFESLGGVWTGIEFNGLEVIWLPASGFTNQIVSDGVSKSTDPGFSGNVFWNNEGTIMWTRATSGSTSRTAFQAHHFSSPFDLDTWVSSDPVVILPVVTSSGVNLGTWWISKDGTTLVTQAYTTFHQFNMSTPFDLTTATHTKSRVIGTLFNPRAYGVDLNNENSYAWHWSSGTSKIYKYIILIDTDIDSISLSGVFFDYETIKIWNEGTPRGIYPSLDGTQLFMLWDDNFNTRHMLTNDLPDPNDISSMVLANDLPGVFQYNINGGFMSWSRTGDKVFESIAGSTDSVNQYSSATVGGGVTARIYHEQDIRLITTSEGIHVTGKVRADGAGAEFILPNWLTGSEPTSGYEGGLIYNKTLARPSFRDGAQWLTLSTQAEFNTLLARYDAHIAGTAERHDATMIDFDGSQIDEPSVTNLNELALYENEEISLRETAPSAQITGGFITINALDPDFSIDVPAGTGEVVDAYTDRAKPTRQVIGWNAVTVDLTAFFSPNPLGVVTVYVTPNPLDLADSTINVVQNPMPNNLTRTNILLAYVFYHDGIIDTVLDSPRLANEVGNALYDFIQYFPPEFRTQGVDIKAVTTPPVASIWNDEGRLFHIGSNVQSGDPTDPNILAFPALGDESTPVPFDIHLQDGSHYSSGVTVIPNFYESAPGVITNLTGNKATIHYVYRTVGGDLILQLGQFTYNTGKEARDNIETDRGKYVYMTGYQSTLFRAQIYYQRNTADFTDPIKAGIVNLGESSGGSASTSVTTFLGLTDVFETTYVGSERLPVAVNDAGDGLVFDTPKIHWADQWAPGLYLEDVMVRDHPWTMVANKDTSDDPSPVPIGTAQWLLPENPAWVFNTFSGITYEGVRITNPDTTYLVDALRVWVESPISDNVFRLYRVDYNTGVSYLIGVFSGSLFPTSGWHDFSIIPILVSPSDDMAFWVSISAESSFTTFTWNYDYIGNLNADVDPGTGNVSTRLNKRKLRVSETDSGAVDRSAQLALLNAGDVITLRNVADPTIFWEFRLDGAGVDEGAWYSFDANLDKYEGQLPTGACTFEIGIPTPAVSQYETISGQFAGDVDLQGGLRLGTGVTTFSNDAHGIDILFQRYAPSEDWDLVAYTGTAGGGGGGGGGTSEFFTDLLDTPGSYAGQKGLASVVNDTETGLVFKALDQNPDGGRADSIYTAQQRIDGGDST